MIIKVLIKKSKNKPVNYKPHDDAPIEETVDLSYDNMTLDDNTSSDNFNVSIGGNVSNDTTQETPQEEVKEEESDLTKFFN